MIEVKFTVASAAELQETIERINFMLSGAPPGDVVKDMAAPSLALYTDAELVMEVERRRSADGQAELPLAGDQQAQPATEAKKPGRPRKLQAVAPAAAPAAAPAEQAVQEAAPDPAAVAVAKPAEPDQSAGTLTQDLPTVDAMLKLMTTVYSKCGDINLVRGIAERVCGKVNLADCDPNKFPELKAELEAKLKELQEAA